MEQTCMCIEAQITISCYCPGTFNMDTPWLYIYTTHKLSLLHRHTLVLTSELRVSKWLTIRNLVLEGFYKPAAC